MRNNLKGSLEDSINLMLAAAAFKFKKLVRQFLDYLLLFFVYIKLRQNTKLSLILRVK